MNDIEQAAVVVATLILAVWFLFLVFYRRPTSTLPASWVEARPLEDGDTVPMSLSSDDIRNIFQEEAAVVGSTVGQAIRSNAVQRADEDGDAEAAAIDTVVATTGQSAVLRCTDQVDATGEPISPLSDCQPAVVLSEEVETTDQSRSEDNSSESDSTTTPDETDSDPEENS